MKNKIKKNLKLDKVQISKLNELKTIRGGNGIAVFSKECTHPNTTKTTPTDLDI